MPFAASVTLGSSTKSLRDRALVSGVALSWDLLRDLRCWVCAVGRGDFASILAQGPLDNQMREQMIVEFENIKAGF